MFRCCWKTRTHPAARGNQYTHTLPHFHDRSYDTHPEAEGGENYGSGEPCDPKSEPAKVLILGIANAGKSTILNQLRFLHGTGPWIEERKMYAFLVHRHIISRMKEYVASQSSPRTDQKEYLIATEENSVQISDQLKIMIKNLWDGNSPQEMYYHDLKYFISNIDRIARPGYIPSMQDISFIRIPTAGVRTLTINYKKVCFEFYDVGGQAGERRKWVHFFDNVHAVIFTAALSDYNETSPEGKNRLAESIEVFSSICTNHHLSDASLILFLNKIDIFERKIAQVGYKSIPDFPRYPGEPKDTQLALKHIEYLYLKCNQNRERKIYGHITCGIDHANIRSVFDSCVETISRRALASMGMV